MTSSDRADIERAIRERHQIEFTYQRQPRIVQPAVLGLHRLTGNLTLRAYQVGGRSNSRVPPFWTLFTVANIHDLHLSEQIFAEDPRGYRDGDAHIHPILAAL
jgi:hypothetical protein